MALQITVPANIATNRLVLRPWRPQDVEDLARAITESVDHLRPWMPWAALEPVSIADRRSLIMGWEQDFDAGGDVVLGIFLSRVAIGGCGLHRRIGPKGLEIGYWIHAHHTRRGYATEVSAALTDVAFTIGGIERVEIHHDRANVASGGVPRTLAFEFMGERDKPIASPGEIGIDCTWSMTKHGWANI